MRLKVLAAIAAAMCLISGSALAEKPNSFCAGVQLQKALIGGVINAQFDAFTKYCDKAPDAGFAAKLAEKTNKKLVKICEKYNKKLAKADCATNADPDIGAPPMPVDCAPFATVLTAATFTSIFDEACNGVDDP